MKKILSFLALALAFTACQTDPAVESVGNDGLVDVVLTVDAPELGVTRADGDTKNGHNSAFGAIDFMTDADWANYDLRYILEVYDANDNGTGEPIYRERLVNCLDKYAPTTFALRLVPNRDYKFVVFADFVAEGNAELTEPADKLAIADLYYNTADLRNISAITTEATWGAMNEVRDAYFVSKKVTITTGLNETLTLTRPFAKLRVIATDLDYITGYAAPGYVEIKYKNEKIYKSFNAVNGQLNADEMTGAELEYAYNVSKTIPYSEGYDAYSTNQTLFTDYLLAVEGQQTTVNFEMFVYEDNTKAKLIHSQDFSTQIPIQRNHLTTIIGDLLTTQANITVDINDDFVDEFVKGWGDDNTTMINSWEAGEYNTATGDYEFVVKGENDFKVTINGAAVSAGKLTVGNYVLAQDAEANNPLTFTVEALQANVTTRALAAVNVIGGDMKVAESEKGYAITLDLVLQFEESKDVRHAIYTYEGAIIFGAALETPVLEATVEGNTVTLTWKAVEGADKYLVAMNDEAAEETTELTKVYEGLAWETTYRFSVKAVNETLESAVNTIEATIGEEPVVETFNLYLNNEDGWANVNLYGWSDNGELFGTWPGTAVTEKETIEGVEYFVFTVPAELNGQTISIIFNNGNDKQTADITGVEITKDNFFTNYVEPAQPSNTILYLKPNANWKADGARFAAYFFGTGNTWCDMTLVEGETDIYSVVAPAGYPNVIFCRMNPGASANDWNNKWNQTADLTVPADGTNFYTVKENTWDNGGGTWGVYTPAVEPEEPTALATPEVKAEVAGLDITLTWEAIENAAQYGITVGTEMPVFVEGTTYTFNATEYETEYIFNVVAVPADEVKFAVSEAAVVTAKTEAAPVVEPEVLAELDADAYYIYKQATEMKGGKWYAIVYENKAATGLTGNYGYLKVTEAASRANGISLPATCAFGFLTTEGDYTIQQFDGKYVYQTGSYDSFNVNANLPADGGVWSVAVEGDEYTITNNTMSKFVQYDPAYNSYGCYATSKGNLPTLYELVEVDNTPAILGVSSSSLSFDANGGSKTATIETYGSATINVSDNADWVSTSLSDNVVTVNAEANSGDARDAVVTITYGDDSVAIAVSQAEYKDPSETPETPENTIGVYTSMDFLFDGKTVSSDKLSPGTNAYKQKMNYDGGTIDVLKLGTSSKAGSYETAAVGVSGKSKLSFYAVGWKGKTVKLTVTVDGNDTEFTLKANTGATGNPPYNTDTAALEFNNETDYYTIDVTGITADSTVSFATDSSGCRALICGVQLY